MAMPHRYPLIFNPKARSQRGQRALRFLMERANQFALYATNDGAEARELAARFAAAGEPVVIAAGGDGTLNAVLCGLAGTATALAVLPTGTMNVFARELGIPCDHLGRALEVIERGFIREIDLFEANRAPFVQLAGVGFDAQVIEETTWERKKALGVLAYLLTAVRVLGDRPPPMEVVCADGRRETGVAVLVGNGTRYGGALRFFHKADNQDAKLDLLIYKEPGYRLVTDSLRGLAAGGIDLMESVSYLQTESCVVRAEVGVPVEVDGELLGRFKEVRFAPAASRLRVVAPEQVLPSRLGERLKTLRSWTPWPTAAVSPRTP
ncbi:MAG: hypothetical protein RLZZ522_1660 [Verrucomicrobiota bacterium]